MRKILKRVNGHATTNHSFTDGRKLEGDELTIVTIRFEDSVAANSLPRRVNLSYPLRTILLLGRDDRTCTRSEIYRFTGKPYSNPTGLYYFYQRWYDPATGRFISPDPKPGMLCCPQSLNPYVYVQDSPLTSKDPTGEGWFDAVVSFISSPTATIANTVSQIGSAAIAVTTSVVNNVVSTTSNVASTVVSTVTSAANSLATAAGNTVTMIANTLSDAGATIWQGSQAVASSFVTNLSKDPLAQAIRQGLEQTVDFLSAHIKITNMDKFARGMVSCGILAVIVVGTVYTGGTALHAYGVASTAAAITVGTAGVGAAALASPGFALGLTHAAEGLINLGAGCLEGLSTIQIG